MLVIVPNHVREAIHTAIDTALQGRPISTSEKEQLYHELLTIFNDTGTIPEFQLTQADGRAEA